MNECDTAVIGAGPYGLSVAAHLHGRRADFRVFGRPLDTWRTAMPRGMYLKSDGFASNLSAPEPGATLADYCLEHDLPYHPTDLPVPLETFVAYGLDFQRRYVPDLEEHNVTSVVRDGRGFRLGLDNGEELRAKQVVVAAGHHPLRLDAADRRRPLAGAGQPLQRPPRPLAASAASR